MGTSLSEKEKAVYYPAKRLCRCVSRVAKVGLFGVETDARVAEQLTSKPK